MNKRFLTGVLTILVMSVLFLVGCGGSGGNTAVPLTVISTLPASGELAVSTSTRIVATFSEPLDTSTVNSSSFYVRTPSGNIPGTVSATGNTATFQPTSPLPANTVLTATLSGFLKSISGHRLTRNYVWEFKTGSTADTIRPTVTSTDPADGETGVSITKKISAIFSEPMTPSTVNTSTFTVTGPGGPISGSVTLLNNVATFTPASNLAMKAIYTARITTGVADLSGNTLAADKVWTFTTGVNADTTPPTVVSTDPVQGATGVPTNKTVSATFSEAMDASTINANTFQLRSPNGTLINATISYSSKIATLNPTALLTVNTLYTATITTGVKDSAGNAMAAPKIWSFTTSGSADTTPPTVISTNPADLATNVALNSSINATFSEAMLASSLNTATFTVAGVSGTVMYDTVNHIATFKPSANLAPNTQYTATISTGAKDSAGNTMVNPKIWTFTTGTQTTQGNINLGSAGTYAVLAGSTVTSTGQTVVNGDLGVSPGSAVTGFPPGIINGALHAGDAAAAQAKTDLLAAQLDAAGRLGALTLPGDLSGLTFTPGLYKNSTSVMLSAGNVTLDALGDVNAVFVFQMGSTLTTSPGTQVVLAGGAKASNVYWSVGTSATLGVSSIFKGIILADASITVNTGAVHSGVLLTRTGAVTLQGNIVTRGRK